MVDPNENTKQVNKDTIVFSIIVPTHNRLSLLRVCLDSLYKLDFPKKMLEIIIVNDASFDGTPYFLDTLSREDLKVLTNISRKGHAYCRNKGFEAAQGCYIASTDDDCLVPRDWLNRFYSHFLKEKDITAVGGSISNALGNRYSEAEYLLNFSSWFPSGKIKRVKNIPTCNIAYDKSEISNLYFDEDSINIGYRDTLFNYKLCSLNHKILFDPSICVFHNGSSNLNAYIRKQRRFGVGFVNRGHRVHGVAGRLILRFPFIHLFHVFCVFTRCIRKSIFLLSFLRVFPILILGELYRVKTIYTERDFNKHVKRNASKYWAS